MYQRIRALFVFIFLLSIFSFGFHQKSYGSHAMALDITYDCLGNGEYVFETRFYRDCDGISAPSSMTLNFNSASCGTSFSQTLPKVDSASAVEVSQLCPSQITNSTCNGGTLPGSEVYTYRDTFAMPDSCPDWTISWSTCCRNGLIDNLQNASSQSMYFEVTMDNSGGLCNSSPNFATLPTPYICTGEQFCYSHGTTDPDGDSLVYQLVNPLGGSNDTLQYDSTNGPPYFGPQYPISTTNGNFSFDSETGQMCFTPDTPQVGVIAIKVFEYRNGNLVGTTIREMQVVVRSCSNQQPYMSSSGMYNVQGGTRIDSFNAEVCPGDSITWQVDFTDPNNPDDITITTNVAAAMPGATFTQTGTNPATGTLGWRPTVLDTGDNFLTVQIQDDGCPVLGAQWYVFNVRVSRGTWAGPDLYYCPGGGPVQLNALGGSSFSWSPSTGLSCSNCSSPMASPSSTTTYVVTSNLSGNCGNTDTVTVYRVPDFNIDAGAEDSICAGASIGLDATVGPASQAPYTYSWTPTSTLSDPTIEDPVANPTSTTTYTLTATSDSGCTMQDSVRVVVKGQAPVLTTSANRYMVCPGDTTALNVSGANCPSCGDNGTSCSNPTYNTDVGTGASSTGLPTPYEGFYEDSRMQMLFTASELTDAGINCGTITEIALNIASKASTQQYRNFTIKMKCTSMSSVSSSFETGLTTVYGPQNYTTTTGWNTHTLDFPFDWDGTSNLLIEICFDNNSYTSDDDVYYTSTTNTSVVYDYTDGSSGCSMSPSPSTSTSRPNVRFTSCDPPSGSATYAWSPSGSLSDTSVKEPIATVNGETTYTVTVDDGNGCTNTASVTVDVDSSVWVTSSPDTATLCPGDSIQINSSVTGGGSPMCNSCGTNGTTCSNPATDKDVGTGGSTGSSTSSETPYLGWWDDGRVQYLYRSSELTGAGINCGTIKEIAFDVSAVNSTQAYSGFTIKMGCTSQSDLSSGTWVTGLTTVYGPVNVNPTVGWNTYTLSAPFDLNSGTNLVVEICYDNASYTYNDPVMYSNTAYTSVLYDYSLSGSGCSLTSPSTATWRPNTRFNTCDAPTSSLSYQWSPSSQVTNDTILDPYGIKSGSSSDTLTLTVTGGTCTVSDQVVLSNCNVLPVELLSFDGQREGDQVHLNWETASEVNANYFVLQRSVSSQEENFQTLSTVTAQGGPDQAHTYEYYDTRPAKGINYYRLKQVNNDGSFKYSKTKAVYFGASPDFKSNISPNPVRKDLNVTMHLQHAGEVDVRVYDMLGKVVHKASHSFQKGSHSLIMDMNDLVHGVYYIEIRVNGQVKDHHKFLKSN